jgi:glucosamine--fructose-6-phosphate aminotransferase (isomerizing)
MPHRCVLRAARRRWQQQPRRAASWAAAGWHQPAARFGRAAPAAAAAAAAGAATAYLWGGSAQACGIVAVVGGAGQSGGRGGSDSNDARGFLLEGLIVLRSRGYDSAGMATMSAGGELVLNKFASSGTTADSIERLRSNSSANEGHSVGIAHTRWATHGAKTDANAHPHSDQKQRLALVHNGTINNATELREELVAAGVEFSSETDSEVVAQLIGHYMDRGVSDLREATIAALGRCDGTWGLAILSRSSPDELVVACNGSPMAIGVGIGSVYVASEPAAFAKYTKNFIAMKDGEIGVVRADGTGLDLARVEVAATEEEVRVTPAPYPHWTIRECEEQPQVRASWSRPLPTGWCRWRECECARG